MWTKIIKSDSCGLTRHLSYRWVMLVLCIGIGMPACAQQQHGNGVDDVLEHVPMAVLLTMKAAGVDNGKGWSETAVGAGMSYVLTAAVVYGLKHTVKEWRPDHSDRRSFPSGHAALAFAGATALHKEYGHVSPWLSVGGYCVATVTAVDRVLRDRHHWYDVVAGAAIGVAGSELSYLVTRRVFRRKQVDVAVAANGLNVTVRW
ncbi:MAG: phosphatase PAP2 family protein [Prevotella sp.]